MVRNLLIRRPNKKTLHPKISGLGGNLTLLAYDNQTKLFARIEGTACHITIVAVSLEKGCELLYQNKVIAQLTQKNVNKVFEITLKIEEKKPFEPHKVSVPEERKILCSVIIPTYNMKDMLKKTLTALFKQSPDEVIVVDDGSNDKTKEMIKKDFPSVRYFYQKRSGRRQQKALNRGLKEAKNDCAIILDADCIPLSDFIRTFKYHFMSNTIQVGMIYPQDKRGEIRKTGSKVRRFLSKREFDKVGTGNLCFSLSKILSIGGFTEDYGGEWGYGNLDFIYKVFYLLDIKIRTNPDARVIHQYHPVRRTEEGTKRNLEIFKQKSKEYKEQAKILKKERIKVLWIIDAYGWAYDVGCDGLYKELGRMYPYWILDKCLWKDVINKEIDPKDYDVTFVWCWCSLHGGFSLYQGVLNNLDPHKSILAIAGEGVLNKLKEHEREFDQFPYMAANNKDAALTMRMMFPEKVIFKLEYGVDLDQFRPKPFPPKFTVGWIGFRQRLIKRFWMAEEVCEKLGVPLKVAGHVTSKDYYIPHHKMNDFYGDMSVLLITSETEVHPLVFYEALASGRPVVSTLVGDIPQTAKDGENGFYLPKDCTIAQIVDRLKRLRDDPDLLRRMGKNARQDVAQEWGWKKIIHTYLYAIKVLTSVFSACMLVSRDNEQMERAVKSVMAQKPTEFRAYIDPVMLPNQKKARKILRAAGAKIFTQNITNVKDHHEDVVEAVHRAIHEAENRVVMWCDDDDEVIGIVTSLIPLVTNKAGIVYGNVRQVFKSGHQIVRHGQPISDPLDMARMKGSVVFYNRDAFRKVHSNVSHGYFWDYQIGYWLLRAGYLLRYFNRTLSIHNVNPNPSPLRKSLYDKWPSMVEEMNKLPLKKKEIVN